jgi:hypothetical protein
MKSSQGADPEEAPMDLNFGGGFGGGFGQEMGVNPYIKGMTNKDIDDPNDMSYNDNSILDQTNNGLLNVAPTNENAYPHMTPINQTRNTDPETITSNAGQLGNQTNDDTYQGDTTTYQADTTYQEADTNQNPDTTYQEADTPQTPESDSESKSSDTIDPKKDYSSSKNDNIHISGTSNGYTTPNRNLVKPNTGFPGIDDS